MSKHIQEHTHVWWTHFMPCWNTELRLVLQMMTSAHCTTTILTKNAVWHVNSTIFLCSYVCGARTRKHVYNMLLTTDGMFFIEIYHFWTSRHACTARKHERTWYPPTVVHNCPPGHYWSGHPSWVWCPQGERAGSRSRPESQSRQRNHPEPGSYLHTNTHKFFNSNTTKRFHKQSLLFSSFSTNQSVRKRCL